MLVSEYYTFLFFAKAKKTGNEIKTTFKLNQFGKTDARRPPQCRRSLTHDHFVRTTGVSNVVSSQHANILWFSVTKKTGHELIMERIKPKKACAFKKLNSNGGWSVAAREMGLRKREWNANFRGFWTSRTWDANEKKTGYGMQQERKTFKYMFCVSNSIEQITSIVLCEIVGMEKLCATCQKVNNCVKTAFLLWNYKKNQPTILATLFLLAGLLQNWKVEIIFYYFSSIRLLTF